MVFGHLGSDRITKGKVSYIILIFVFLVVISWYSSQVPAVKENASLYWWFLMTSLIGVILALFLKKFKFFDLDVPLYEKPMIPIPPTIKKFILPLIFLVGVVTFLTLSQSGYAIATPSYQVIELGTGGRAILTGISAMAEDLFFFSIVAGLIFSITLLFTRNPLIASGAVLLLVPTVFMNYHILHYGYTEIPQMVSCWVFGFEAMLSVLLLRNILWANARHVGNNLGRFVFSQMTLTGFVIYLLGNPWFWLIVVIGIIFFILKRFTFGGIG